MNFQSKCPKPLNLEKLTPKFVCINIVKTRQDISEN